MHCAWGPSMHRLTAGAYVTPSIRLVERLGQGAMGCVWTADHLTLHSRVAVKFLADALAAEPECVERFAREAAAAAQVRSPHVVQVFDYGIGEHGSPYIVMELLEGRDLGAHLRERVCLTLHEVVSIVRQACRALSWAHARGVVHRDVKPENIFLCDQPGDELFVKLLDFGIAKARIGRCLTANGVWLGSPSYMSPEQLEGSDAVDGRSDSWSLAVVAYEALTGKKPFGGESLPEILERIRTATHVPPSVLVPALPRSIDAWFARACAVDPARRFDSVADMSRALEHAARESFELSDTVAADVLVPSTPFPLVPRARPREVELDLSDDPLERPSVRDLHPEERRPRRSRGALLFALAVAGAAAAWVSTRSASQPFVLAGAAAAAPRRAVADELEDAASRDASPADVSRTDTEAAESLAAKVVVSAPKPARVALAKSTSVVTPPVVSAAIAADAVPDVPFESAIEDASADDVSTDETSPVVHPGDANE